MILAIGCFMFLLVFVLTARTRREHGQIPLRAHLAIRIEAIARVFRDSFELYSQHRENLYRGIFLEALAARRRDRELTEWRKEKLTAERAEIEREHVL